MPKLTIKTEPWELKKPFRITGYEFSGVDLLHVTVAENGAIGHGEAAGIFYLDENAASMREQVTSVGEEIERGAGREELLELLPPGGARNALDCALWDLEAKRADKSIWELTNIFPGPTSTVLTIGIASPEEMARNALSLDVNTIKVKLDNDLCVERIAAIRDARPDAHLVVDVNGGWTFDELVEYAPQLKKRGVSMIEQPLPRGQDAELEGYGPPLILCADESCLNLSEFEQAARRYQMINIKLDKTGGLTEALRLADLAESREIGLMVGNMMGTSLAMAPAYVVAQLCTYVDLDGALFMSGDREHPMYLAGGFLSAPSSELWG
jgi:L-alanine-DL-glutamate epimerase-like enolase superfamily enzyme